MRMVVLAVGYNTSENVDTFMASSFGFVTVILLGLYLVGLAAVAIFAPVSAKQFLSGFASSAFTHYVELTVRLVIGISFVLYSPRMKFAYPFLMFGWVVIATTIGLFALPWRWHRWFANGSVPIVTRNMPLFALGAFVGGLCVLLSVIFGPGFEK